MSNPDQTQRGYDPTLAMRRLAFLCFLFFQSYSSTYAQSDVSAEPVVAPDGDPVMEINLALYKLTSIHTVEGPGFEGLYAVDGDYNTRWSSDFFGPQWLIVDLEVAYRLNAIKITWDDSRVVDYQVHVSVDSVVWERVTPVGGNSTFTGEDIGLNSIARYVRIYGNASEAVRGFSIKELEVFGMYSENDQKSPVVSPPGEATGGYVYLDDLESNLIVNGANPGSEITILNVMTHEVVRLTTSDRSLDIEFLHEGKYVVEFFSGNKLVSGSFSKQ